jgi:ribosomal protein S27E
MKTRETAYKDIRQAHYLLVCPYCGTELVVSHGELKRALYEPHEETYEYWQGGIGDEYKRIGKQMVSSDPSKDEYRGIKCCNCGHVWSEYVNAVHKNACGPDGQQTKVFELPEGETAKAQEFVQKHIHKCCPNRPFTTMGMQFTYTITPGGLGPMVTIKCNACGETENITCTEDW